MNSLTVIDQELRPNGSFPYRRIHTLDPIRTYARVESGYVDEHQLSDTTIVGVDPDAGKSRMTERAMEAGALTWRRTST